MPIPEVESIEKDSSESTKKAAMSACVASMVREGTPQDQAVAICADMISKKAGA
jgi:hypothetical protein